MSRVGKEAVSKGSDRELSTEPEPTESDIKDTACKPSADLKLADSGAIETPSEPAEHADEAQPLLDAPASAAEADGGGPEPAPAGDAKLPPVTKSRRKPGGEPAFLPSIP